MEKPRFLGELHFQTWQSYRLAVYKKIPRFSFLKRSTQKKILVWLHPFALDSHVWRYQQEAVPGDVEQVAIDFPGHGETQGSIPSPLTGQDLCEVVKSVISSYDTSHLYFVGNSLGGAVAMQLAAEFPERTSKVVVCSPFHPMVFTLRAWRKSIPRMISILRRHPRVFSNLAKIPVRKSLIELSFRLSPEKSLIAIEQEGYRSWLTNYYAREENRRNLLMLLPALTNWPDFNENLRQIKAGVEIYWGRDDQTLPVESSDFYKENVAHSILKILPGIGHTPQLEVPAVIRSAIAKMFK